MRPTLLLPLLLACGPTGSGTVAALPDDTGASSPTSPTGTTPTVLAEGVTLEDGPVVQPHKILTVDLDSAAGLTVVCTMDGDPTEVITLRREEASDQHAVDLLGLAAGESYTCSIEADGADPVEVQFDVALLDHLPQFTVERNENLPMSGAWTVVNTTGGCFQNSDSYVIVVDPEGRHRWSYDVGDDLVADVQAGLTPEGQMHMGGGWGLLDPGQSNRGVFKTVELDGTVVHDREEPDFGLGFNHHSEAMEDGSFLSLTTSLVGDAFRDWYGVGVERWHPDDGVVYSWDSQGMIDAGQVGWNGDDNPYHANSITWIDDQQGPAMLISLYSAQEIWRIDRNTGLRTWRLGPGGDFDLVDPSGTPLPDEEWFYVQHDPDWTADGRVLLYDNGYQRPGPDYSRVAEYQIDPDTMTATLLWSWTEPGFYNPVVGDADWLPNGNVLVAKGFMICWTPQSNDVSAVVELDPANNEVAWRMSWPDRDQVMFRAERYDGCDLFAENAKYCN